MLKVVTQMSRDADNKNLVNLWGRQTDVNMAAALEPQRSDVFLVDLTLAAGGIQSVARIKLNTQLRQFVRSVSLPEVKLKPETFRRDSVPYNMPHWDEPVEGVKIVFLVDTWNGNDRCDTADLLDAWIALARAGRGARYGGFAGLSPQGFFTLDSNFRVACCFDIGISLLRGNMQNIIQGLTDSTTLPQMQEHTRWVLRQCWCAGYKLSDLNYTESQLMTLEATFYPEAVERSTSTINFSGTPLTT